MLTKGEKEDWDVLRAKGFAFVSWEKLLLLLCFYSLIAEPIFYLVCNMCGTYGCLCW
jgi:hypothetical protein